MTLKIRSLVFVFILCSVASFAKGPSDNKKPLSGKEVSLKVVYNLAVKGHVSRLRVKMIVPDNIKNRQDISKLTFSVKPDSIYNKKGNRYAEFSFSDLSSDLKITMKCHVIIYKRVAFTNEDTQAELSRFLVAEKDIECDSPKIMAVAATLKQNTDIETVMKTYEYVKGHVRYKLKDAIGAAKVLETGVGKCMDYSDLFVALLRANKIPAKSIFGMVTDAGGNNPLHAWSEVYLKRQGWIRMDATSDQTEITQNGKDYVMTIDNKYITLSEGRNDPELKVSMCGWSWKGEPGNGVLIKSSIEITDDEFW
jgi:transglutaminase-like putative cysteine protease